MEAWIALFSKFTDEFLLFELLGMFLLVALYCAFWILRKRKYGSSKQELVPAGVVRYYLHEVIGDAQKLQNQLFGLLGRNGEMIAPAAGATLATYANAPAGASAAGSPIHVGAIPAGLAGPSPDMLAKLQELERKTVDQQKQIEALLADKKALEAKAAAGGAAAAGGDTSGLEKKIKELQEKLDEYSVIEDDLANLKRLQQENAQLKAQLGGAAGATAAAAPTPAPKAAPAPVAAAPAPAVEAPTPAEFEKVVDQVEQAITPPPEAAAAPAPAATPEPVAAAPAPAAEAAPATPPAAEGQSEDALLAEFEKMLNG